MAIHYLKEESNFFDDVAKGDKGFEIRYNDRNYKVNDILVLSEIDSNKKYVGEHLIFEVIYLQTRFVQVGYVALGLKRIEKHTRVRNKKIYLIKVYVGKSNYIEGATFNRDRAKKICKKIEEDYNQVNKIAHVEMHSIILIE